MSLPPPAPTTSEKTAAIEAIPPSLDAAECYEQTHVHDVYDTIAPHFSATRYKPWPVVASFLASLPPGSVGYDVGCGNGKYLDVNPSLCLIGSDRSAALVQIAQREKSGEALVADGLALPFRRNAAHFAICVAVVHHLSTRERRRDMIRGLLDCVRDDTGVPADGISGGRVLIYVWALEQENSRRGWDESAEQDQLVPWVLKRNIIKKTKNTITQKESKETRAEEERGGLEKDVTDERVSDETFQRYYHLYRKGELEDDVSAAGGLVEDAGYDRDNWYVIARRRSIMDSRAR